ncbi:MAG TPA: OsmC family protein [Gammaproteobacteria bacterium]|nr:OsmC family protein [Gammaproteobacteria bacterium]
MSEKHALHHYQAVCSWRGSTAAGYEAYDRSHELRAPPAPQALSLSSDPAFRGDPQRLNPEQLLLMAAASCQLLSFLAIAARARLEVVEYEDRAEGFMPEDDKPVHITRIVLKPRIVLRGAADAARVRRLVDQAHHACFIANSLKSTIEITPEIVIRP